MMYFKFFSERKKFYIMRYAVLYDDKAAWGLSRRARDFEDVHSMDRREIA